MSPSQSTSPLSFSDLTSALRDNGLEMLGTFEPEESETLVPDRSAQPKCVAIVGNVSSAIWPYYEAARQESKGLTLDRWTQTVVDGIAHDFAIDAVYPFDGPPFHPFIRWAQRTGTLFSSPIGLTIHPTYGLWLAFRAALLIDRYDPAKCDPKPALRHPCDDCQDRPCLTTCPVGAFYSEGYDFATCLDHLATPINDCRQGGCLARIACPVGQKHRYRRDHAAFHMQQLLRAHGRAASAD